MEIEGATELLEKCKAKGVLHKAEAEFIKGFASDMILFPVQLRTAQARHHGRAEENQSLLEIFLVETVLGTDGVSLIGAINSPSQRASQDRMSVPAVSLCSVARADNG
jgi:hypothetical protein